MHKIVTEDLILTTAQISDVDAFCAFEQRNKKHFAQFSPSYELSDEQFKNLIATWVEDNRKGNSVRFFIFPKSDETRVIGCCNFTNMVRGPFQACYLGYKMDADWCGKGLMTQALQASIAYMFDELNLHRIMANYVPENHASAKLLQRLGFTIEGTAKEYLLINATWKDHVLTSRINHAWKNKSNG